MRKLPFFNIILGVIVSSLLVSCKARNNDDDNESHKKIKISAETINDISEEYKRIDKMCNEIEIKLDELDRSQTLSYGTKTEIKNTLIDLKKAIMNIETEFKANLLKDKNFDKELSQTGFNFMIIEELDKRVTKLQVHLNDITTEQNEPLN
jgi:hypothetical protein